MIRDLGRLFKENPHYDADEFDWLCFSIETHLGKRRFYQIIKRDSQKCDFAKCFYESYLQIAKKREENKRRIPQKPRIMPMIFLPLALSLANAREMINVNTGAVLAMREARAAVVYLRATKARTPSQILQKLKKTNIFQSRFQLNLNLDQSSPRNVKGSIKIMAITMRK